MADEHQLPLLPEADQEDLRPDGRKWGSLSDSERFEDLVRQHVRWLKKRKERSENPSTPTDDEEE